MTIELENFYKFKPVEIAIFASRIGFYVFPADPATKRPLIKGWQTLASRDPEEIQSLWASNPSAMIAVVTGNKSGYFVIDVDIEEGEDPNELYRNFADSVGGLPDTLTVNTPSGGMHKYIRMPENIDLRNSVKKLGKGIDIRANGGYVIFAGSVRSDGKVYTFAEGSL